MYWIFQSGLDDIYVSLRIPYNLLLGYIYIFPCDLSYFFTQLVDEALELFASELGSENDQVGWIQYKLICFCTTSYWIPRIQWNFRIWIVFHTILFAFLLRNAKKTRDQFYNTPRDGQGGTTTYLTRAVVNKLLKGNACVSSNCYVS